MKRVALKKKKVGSQSRIHQRDDLAHWEKLEMASKQKRVPSVNGKTMTGRNIKEQALEWLRLESIRLAYKNCSDEFLDAFKAEDLDVRHAFGSDRDGLICLPPQYLPWVYPYYFRRFREARCFKVLNPDEIHFESLRRECRSGRVVISLDPRFTERVKKALAKFLKEKRDGKRAPGAGSKWPLLKLREALLCYERWLARAPITPQRGLGPHIYRPTQARDKILMRDLGDALLSYKTPSGDDPYKCETKARDILRLAVEMMQTAVPFAAIHESGESPRKPKGLVAWPDQYQ